MSVVKSRLSDLYQILKGEQIPNMFCGKHFLNAVFVVQSRLSDLYQLLKGEQIPNMFCGKRFLNAVFVVKSRLSNLYQLLKVSSYQTCFSTNISEKQCLLLKADQGVTFYYQSVQLPNKFVAYISKMPCSLFNLRYTLDIPFIHSCRICDFIKCFDILQDL